MLTDTVPTAAHAIFYAPSTLPVGGLTVAAVENLAAWCQLSGDRIFSKLVFINVIFCQHEILQPTCIVPIWEYFLLCNCNGSIVLTLLHNQAEIFVVDHIEHLEYLASQQNSKLVILLSGYTFSLRLQILIITQFKKQKCVIMYY